ncbi:hypothetical protein ACWKWC_02700 [Geodermatophilus nigrescens]
MLLLAAVFLGHGLQCGSAADHTATAGAETAHVAAVHDGRALTASVVRPAGDAHLTGSAAGHVPAAAAATAPAPQLIAGAAAFEVTAGPAPGHWHGPPGHLWMVCLAVLAAGMTVLLALLTPRLLGLAAPAAARLRRGAICPALLRPPDLSSLCVLRI